MDLQEAFDAGFVAVKAYVDDALAAQQKALPDIVRAAVSEAMAVLPEPKAGLDGKDAPPVTEEQLEPVVRRYMEDNPPAAGRDGADGKDGEPGPQGEKGESGVDGRDGANGLDGKDAEPISEDQIAEAVARHLEANPPAPGKDGRDGVDGKDGRDGVDATEALIDKDGNLVVVFSDGRSKSLGLVVGRDGVDGAKGEPGRDGLTLTDFDTELSEDGRFLTFSMENEGAKITHRLQLPTMIYRGGYKEGITYLEGDTVTFGGSLWCCSAETTEKPVEGRDCWRLAARKGRDGKDAKP